MKGANSGDIAHGCQGQLRRILVQGLDGSIFIRLTCKCGGDQQASAKESVPFRGIVAIDYGLETGMAQED